MSFDALDISASALYAQRTRMDTIASNIANINTTRNPDGTPGPYRRKEVVFSAVYDKAINQPGTTNNFYNNTPSTPFIPSMPSMSISSGGNMVLNGRVSMDTPQIANGVVVSQIVEDQSPFKKTYNPSHPDADENGYVNTPNINVVTEMVDMIQASRAYEANVTAIDATKNIMSAALRI